MVLAALPGSEADSLNFDALTSAVAVLDPSLAAEEVGQGDTDEADPRNWTVQIGAYRNQTQAMERLATMEAAIAEIAPDADRLILPNKSRGRTLYRARFAEVTAAEAEAVCDALKPKGEDCLALPPGR